MSRDNTSVITHISWGRMQVNVNGEIHYFKDCKVWPSGAKEWDWKITRTRHQPGIQPTDIQEILDQGVDFLVLSRGMQLMLHTCPETEELLRSLAIEHHIGQTQLAVALFNDLVKQGRKVGGIFHSTC